MRRRSHSRRRARGAGHSIPDDLARAAKRSSSFKLLALVHAETSTGVLQDLSHVPRPSPTRVAPFFVVDAVTSLAGVAVDVDRHGIDAVYSGTQKCLSCPPGLSPVSFSERARAGSSPCATASPFRAGTSTSA